MTEVIPATEPALLEALGVPRDRLLYVQASVDWMQRAGLAAPALLSTLREWIGTDGTLVMPSYPFHTTHLEYLESAPVFDVRRTPSTIGLLPEMLRRTRGAVRSLDPDFSVCALGADAGAITGSEPCGEDPFGPDSSYQRMLDRGAVLVGIGVSLNTTSFIHAIDSRAQHGYPAPVYTDTVYGTQVIDTGGTSRQVARRALRPPFQRLIAPSAINDQMLPPPSVFTTLAVNGATFFRWELQPWAAWCLAHARERAGTADWPCWLARLGASSVGSAI